MNDLATVLWKEAVEFWGNRRYLRVFATSVIIMGILPSLNHAHGHGGTAMLDIIDTIYVLFAAIVVVAQTAPDLVLHERVGHTLDYLLTTRLPDSAIFGAKGLMSFAVGYSAAMLSMMVQLVSIGLISGNGFHWLFLATPIGRVIAFGLTAGIALYVAVVGTFVGVRVGEQRAAYMVTMLSVGLLIGPFLIGWIPFTLTLSWATRVTVAINALAIVLGLVGLRLFRRDMLVLYLQE